MGVKDVWLGNAPDINRWRDIMFQVTGPMAVSLQSAFAGLWTGSTGEILVGDEFYPQTSSSPGSPVSYIPLASTPAEDTQALSTFFLLSIRAAREKLYITTPYFVPDADIVRALKNRARDKVDVRILLPGGHTDHRVGHWISQGYYHGLLQAGVKIYEYQPTFNHSKFLVADQAWSIIGSANLNSRSRMLDEENILGIYDEKLGGTLENIFLKDLRRAKNIGLTQWQRRNVFVRFLEGLAWLFSKQF
jgi:cardiolipin synthase